MVVFAFTICLQGPNHKTNVYSNKQTEKIENSNSTGYFLYCLSCRLYMIDLKVGMTLNKNEA